jgi:hypothetical protein
LPTDQDLLRSLEGMTAEAKWPVLCFLAGRAVEIDPNELNGAIRRAELLLATGGDPRRALDLDGRATTAVAADLDAPRRREQLRASLERLQRDAHDLAGTDEALQRLIGDDDLAWRCYALALLAAELADES